MRGSVTTCIHMCIVCFTRYTCEIWAASIILMWWHLQIEWCSANLSYPKNRNMRTFTGWHSIQHTYNIHCGDAVWLVWARSGLSKLCSHRRQWEMNLICTYTICWFTLAVNHLYPVEAILQSYHQCYKCIVVFNTSYLCITVFNLHETGPNWFYKTGYNTL